MDRPDISRLNKNRSIYLKLGFVIALSLTVMAFNYTVYDNSYENFDLPVPEDKEILQTVVRTVQKPKPPPPVLKPSEIAPDIDFEPEPEPIEPEPVEPVILPEPGPISPDPGPVIAPEPEPEPPGILLPDPMDDEPEMPFIIVEQMPRFAGCEDQGLSDEELKLCSDKKMIDFIYSNVKYPGIARENGIEGVVVASFIVEKDGSISGLKILRDIGGGCGNEVVRIVKKMPDWIAGEQRGRKVRVQFNLPVKFSLE